MLLQNYNHYLHHFNIHQNPVLTGDSDLDNDKNEEKLSLPAYSSATPPPPPSAPNILPSYYMYKSIILKSLKLMHLPPPPPYEPPDDLSSTPSTLYPTLSTESLESSSNSSTTILNNLKSLHNLKTIDITIQLQNEKFEYKQGDIISGTIEYKNKKKFPVNFSMIYILFEGIISINNYEKVFLSMIDFNSFMNQPPSSSSNVLQLLPNTSYVKSFYFVIPQYLLDSTCGFINQHLQLPPSLTSERDLSVMNGNIKYKISTYIISSNTKEYLNIGQSERCVRLVPFYDHTSMCITRNETFTYAYMFEIMKRDLMFISKSKIDESLSKMELKVVNSLQFKFKKQLYKLQVPLKPIQIAYVPLKSSLTPPNNPNLNQIVKLRFKLTLPPQFIKSIKMELVAVTIKSSTSIPIIVSNEMIYQTFSNSITYNDIIIRPIRRLLNELNYKNVAAISPHLSSIFWKLLNSSVKYTPLTIDDSSYSYDSTTNDYDLKLSLKSMYIKNLDKAVVDNRFGMGFNLLPNFQSCYFIRKYYCSIVVKLNNVGVSASMDSLNNNNQLCINIPIEVVENI